MHPPKTHGVIPAGFAFVVAFALVSSAGAQGPTTRVVPLEMGDTSIDLVVHRAPALGLTYLNLHDDENTAVEATLDVLGAQGGTLFELRHTGERTITFELGDSTFTVDPNRIFTAGGVASTLARHGLASPRAQAAVRSFADTLLRSIEFDGLSILATVHNNSDDAYSVLSYDDGGGLASDADLVHVNTAHDPDDFYFVTSRTLYDELRASGVNAVLQDNHLVEDDGSLSVLAGRRGIPYVNVEAEHGHLDEQREMIGRLHDVVMKMQLR